MKRRIWLAAAIKIAIVFLFLFSYTAVQSAERSKDSVYNVIVDYSMTLKKMISVGKYDWVVNEINRKNFPIDGEGKAEVKLQVVYFDRELTTGEILAELDKRGLRSATLPELLAFGAKYPKKQIKYPIFALGSIWRAKKDLSFIPCLFGFNTERFLALRRYDLEWYDYYRFLAVRK